MLGVHDDFTWRDGERVIRFGRGALGGAVELLGGPGYTLLTTERTAAMAPGVVEAAGAVHHVPSGLVDEVAAGLLDEVSGDRVVALGGGRVVDVAKAIVAARGGRAMAIPTTLSGAEMTRVHRMPAGVKAEPVRPAVVVNDPALSASQPVADLTASALNALGHAAEAPCTRMANPVATLAALYAARLLVGAYAVASPPDREALARGALLAGYAIDSAGYGLHHVLSQTLVRVAGLGHGQANAIMLPHSLGALAWRFPHQHQSLTDATGGDPSEAAARLCAMTGPTTLADLGVDHDGLVACADAAAQRSELDFTPPRADRAELIALYEAAA